MFCHACSVVLSSDATPRFISMVKRRKELAAHTTFFAESFAALADSEEIDSLKNAMHQMADVEAKVGRLHSKQEHRDFYDMSEIINDFVAMCGGMKVEPGPVWRMGPS